MKISTMKKYLLSLSLLFILASCETEIKLTEEDKKLILEELSEINEVDQQFAGLPPEEMRAEYGNERAWEIFLEQRDSVGLVNQGRIKALYQQYGYLGEKKIGEEGASDFWISIQHADNDVEFQQEMLEAMQKEIENGSQDKYHYAMLEDRVNVNLGKPQRFGSQLEYNELGQAIPKNGLVDSANVEVLRAEYDMPTFKEYYNGMTSAHFEMNKEYFLGKGITEPQLYK